MFLVVDLFCRIWGGLGFLSVSLYIYCIGMIFMIYLLLSVGLGDRILVDLMLYIYNSISSFLTIFIGFSLFSSFSNTFFLILFTKLNTLLVLLDFVNKSAYFQFSILYGNIIKSVLYLSHYFSSI